MSEHDSGTLAAPDTWGTRMQVRAATLEITAGPDAGRRARVDRPTCIVGTGTAADLRLTDPTVSREHLRISLTPEGLHLRDGGSRNGTWMGGVRLLEAILTSDAALSLGTTTIALCLDGGLLELPLSERTKFGRAVGISRAMRHLFAILERAAASDITVLLEGESGVGKEVVAKALHDESRRAGKPFVAVDCGSIPANLLESELFGHERGAFTGAVESRRGLFEQAGGGTLFLDEIGELPLELQPKLLRVLEQREIRPVGASTPRPIDVRIVAATNRCLAEAAERNEFRRDLFFRLAVARVTIPPLRDRPEDIAPLAREFLRAALGDPAAELPEPIGALFRSYAWPGNVRELRNAIERYVLLGIREPNALLGARPPPPPEEDPLRLSFQDARRHFERAYVTKVLERAGGNVTRAAELAQVARPSFHRMLDRLRERTELPDGDE